MENESREKFDWSKFTIRTPINASAKEVFRAWTSQEELEKWFLRLAEFSNSEGLIRNKNERIEAGDTYKWRWHGYPDSVEEFGEILELNEKDFLKFSFGKAGIVSIKLTEQEGRTFIELTQEDIPHYKTTEENYHVGCKTGWTFYLANLNSVIQGGLDLRNKDRNLQMD
ncbi:SRPBCC family protein [Salegentibacter chungangensis]|uniref:SRPBCC domain-containing protein n=1 Tax=Salegentibacter chungangensis TaxID=1335724 RepID=A0ABW3NSZ3_9FLAO